MARIVRAGIELLRRLCCKLLELVVPVQEWLSLKEGGVPVGVYPEFGSRVIRVVYEPGSGCFTEELAAT